MKKKLRILVMLVLAAVFIGSLTMVILRSLDYRRGEEAYAEAESLVQLPDLSGLEIPEPAEPTDEPEQEVYIDPYADALRSMDFTALREVNDDVLGWILIPNTVISYPLLQGEDNQYYLTHTRKKWTSAVGAIFMDSQNNPDLTDFNTIVYGHRMNNGSRFASLKNYKQQSYWQSHPCVYITGDHGSYKYDIFAAYEVSTQGITYQLGFSGDADKQEFLDACMAQSVIDTGIVPTVHDRILTLSTCTGNGHATRWVVQAVLRCEAPAEPQPEETLPADSQSAQTAPVETVPEETAPEEGAENAAADSALQTTDEQQSPESAASEEAEPQSEAESTAPQTQQQEDLQEEPVTSAEEPVSSQTPQEGTENP